MSDVDRLLGWWADGTLVRPDPSRGNLVDLTRALGRTAGGIAGAPVTAAEAAMDEAIASPSHLVFVLIDGLGEALLERLPPGSFLRSHRVMGLTSVFPPTTAAALTTIGTGTWPATHAVLGWWLYLPDSSLCTTILSFVERYSKRPLTDLSVAAADAFPTPSIATAYRRRTCWVMPARIADSIYTRYQCGGQKTAPYDAIDDAIDAVVGEVVAGSHPSFTHLYLPQLDGLCHETGPQAPEVDDLLAAIDAAMAALRDRLPHGARLVVTADHGQKPLRAEGEIVIEDDDPLLSLLRCPPTGEPAAPLFHVVPGCEQRFEAEFRSRFGRVFALLSAAEVEELRLFGPEPLSRQARERLGDYLALSAQPVIMHHVPNGEPRGFLRGVHAGLTPEEMLVPLIVA